MASRSRSRASYSLQWPAAQTRHDVLGLSSSFPDAMLFEHCYTVFCPECAKKNPTPGKHNKFGYGFCSQYSVQSAKRNWNNACMRFARRSINDVLNGK